MQAFAEKCPVGAEVEGEIKNITEFGLFVECIVDVITIMGTQKFP